MIITDNIIKKLLYHRNTSILLQGTCSKCMKLFDYGADFGKDNISKDNISKDNILYDIPFTVKNNIYYISILKKHKKNISNLLKDITKSPNYYDNKIQKKIIILLNFQELTTTYQQAIKTIIDTSYLSCIFILHTSNLNFVDRNIVSRVIYFTLPEHIIQDDTIEITYQKIIKIIKQNTLTSKVVDTIRELSYMFYMNHTHSTDLQKLLVERIGLNLYIPNSVKYAVVEDICRINQLYQHSYRKPIFLEFIIISLCKHLENYTYHL